MFFPNSQFSQFLIMQMTPRNQTLGRIVLNVSKFILAISLAAARVSVAQTNMTIYSRFTGQRLVGWEL